LVFERLILAKTKKQPVKRRCWLDWEEIIISGAELTEIIPETVSEGHNN